MDEIKKVVLLTFECPPTHGGGLSTYVGHASKALSAAGVEVTVICPRQDKAGNARVVEQTPFGRTVWFDHTQHFASKYMGHWPAMSYAISDELKWIAETYGLPDLVEACDGFAIGYFALQRKLTLEAPFDRMRVVVTSHTPTAMIDDWDGHNLHALPLYWTTIMEKWALRAADAVHVPSHFLIDKLHKEFDLADVAMEHVPNPYRPGLDFGVEKAQIAADARDEIPDREFAAVISRVAKWKGVPAIIAAFTKLWDAGETIQLRDYGTDTLDPSTNRSMKAALSERYADYVADERLVFAGLAPPHRLPAIRAAAVFQVHPSENENFPYTVVEALADGNIVIANRNGGQGELIRDGVDGLLYDATDPAGFAAAYRRLHALDSGALEEMRASARARVADVCSYETFAAQKLAAMKSLAPRPDRPARYPFVAGHQTLAPKPETAPSSGAEAVRLTVVIPYFNMQDWIDETLESIAASTLPAKVILVNDGSTHPDTDATLSRLQTAYPRMQIITKPNSGVADTRNVGVKAADTEFVALLDADDVVTPDYYRQAVAVLDAYENVSFVGSWADDFDDNGTIRYWPTFSPEPPGEYIFNMVNAQSLIYRRAAYLDAGQHDPDLMMYLDDWEGVISLLAAGYRGVMIPHPLFRYRIRPDSIFRSGTSRWQKNYAMIVDKHADTFAKHAAEISKFLIANGPNSFYHNPTFPSGLRRHGVRQDPFYDGRLMKLARNYYRYMYDEGPRPVALTLRKVFILPFMAIYTPVRAAARALRG